MKILHQKFLSRAAPEAGTAKLEEEEVLRFIVLGAFPYLFLP